MAPKEGRHQNPITTQNTVNFGRDGEQSTYKSSAFRLMQPITNSRDSKPLPRSSGYHHGSLEAVSIQIPTHSSLLRPRDPQYEDTLQSSRKLIKRSPYNQPTTRSNICNTPQSPAYYAHSAQKGHICAHPCPTTNKQYHKAPRSSQKRKASNSRTE